MTRFLKSDLSPDEAYLFVKGTSVYGMENAITGLYKIIGKYLELAEEQHMNEITLYNPDEDKSFKYENMGITSIKNKLNHDFAEQKITRKELKTLSRKWPMSFVYVSKRCVVILDKIRELINTDNDLSSVCYEYLNKYNGDWKLIMPVQMEFLSVRYLDRRKDFHIAKNIMNGLDSIIM